MYMNSDMCDVYRKKIKGCNTRKTIWKIQEDFTQQILVEAQFIFENAQLHLVA